jgi:hypothetical protein
LFGSLRGKEKYMADNRTIVTGGEKIEKVLAK